MIYPGWESVGWFLDVCLKRDHNDQNKTTSNKKLKLYGSNFRFSPTANVYDVIYDSI